MSVISRTFTDRPEIRRPLGAVVALTGRNVSVGHMYGFMIHAGLTRSVTVVLEPRNLQWYPQPNGPQDQGAAVAALVPAVRDIKRQISMIRKFYDIPYNRIAVVGYSAGGVMALTLAQHCQRELAMIMSIAGTVLDPATVVQAQHNTPIVMKHCEGDECFEWNERHVPARDAMIAAGYNMILEERPGGSHNLGVYDAHLINRFVGPRLGY